MQKNNLPIWVLISCLLGSCVKPQQNTDSSSSSGTSIETPSPLPGTPAVENEISENASVDTVEIALLESFPLQASVTIKGNLPDSCTTIQRHEVSSKGNTFFIKIFTQRPKEAVCAQVLVPFEYIAPLNVYGLPAGVYQVSVYNISDGFTLDRDNIQQSTGSG